MTDDNDVDIAGEAGDVEDKDQASGASDADSAEAESSSDVSQSDLDQNMEDQAANAGDESSESEVEAADDAEIAGENKATGDDSDPGDKSESAEELKVVNESDVSEDDAEAAMMKMLEGLPEEEDRVKPDDINFGSAAVGDAEFQQLSQPAGETDSRNIDILMDVDLPVSIELGRTKMSIADILALGPGAVVELNKLAGEPVDLLVNQKAVARGEVVVVDESFGLRITQLMTAEERLKALADE